MSKFLGTWALFLSSLVLPELGNCLNEVLFQREEGKHLPGRVIETKHTNSEFECSLYCTIEESCLSVNYKYTGESKGLCELNDEALLDPPENGLAQPEFSYLGVVDRVRKYISNTFCLTSFNPRVYDIN